MGGVILQKKKRPKLARIGNAPSLDGGVGQTQGRGGQTNASGPESNGDLCADEEEVQPGRGSVVGARGR